jgi:hypothetical protein
MPGREEREGVIGGWGRKDARFETLTPLLCILYRTSPWSQSQGAGVRKREGGGDIQRKGSTHGISHSSLKMLGKTENLPPFFPLLLPPPCPNVQIYNINACVVMYWILIEARNSGTPNIAIYRIQIIPHPVLSFPRLAFYKIIAQQTQVNLRFCTWIILFKY